VVAVGTSDRSIRSRGSHEWPTRRQDSQTFEECGGRRRKRFYAFFIPRLPIPTPSIFAATYSDARSGNRHVTMDLAYLALLAVLVALTWGFLRLCARLEDRK
jgi:hypothetical protein